MRVRIYHFLGLLLNGHVFTQYHCLRSQLHPHNRIHVSVSGDHSLDILNLLGRQLPPETCLYFSPSPNFSIIKHSFSHGPRFTGQKQKPSLCGFVRYRNASLVPNTACTSSCRGNWSERLCVNLHLHICRLIKWFLLLQWIQITVMDRIFIIKLKAWAKNAWTPLSTCFFNS